jgi:hypothetical protein
MSVLLGNQSGTVGTNADPLRFKVIGVRETMGFIAEITGVLRGLKLPCVYQ